MARLRAIVYDPPAPGLPFLGVVIIDREVKLVLPAKSARAAKAALEEALKAFARSSDDPKRH
jgi:hypothetical protein